MTDRRRSEAAIARDRLFDAVAGTELFSPATRWTIVADCAAGTPSVHGIYDDTLDALFAATALSADLNPHAPCVAGTVEPAWDIRIVPYFD
jgi:hypothetical protein